MKKIRILILGSTLLAPCLLINAASTVVEKKHGVKVNPLAQKLMRFEERLVKRGQVLFKSGMPKEAIDQELELLREKFQEDLFCEEFKKAQKARLQQQEAGLSVMRANREYAALSLKTLKAEGKLTPRLQNELEDIERYGLVRDPLTLEQNLQRRSTPLAIEEKNREKEKNRKDASNLLKYLEDEAALTSWLKNSLEGIIKTGVIQDEVALRSALEPQYALVNERKKAQNMKENREQASEWLHYFEENNKLPIVLDELQQRLHEIISKLREVASTGIVHDKAILQKQLRELYASIENSKTLTTNRATTTLPALVPTTQDPAKSMPPRTESAAASTTLPTSKHAVPETRRQLVARALGFSQAMSKTTPTLPTVTPTPADKQAPAKSMPPRAESVAAGTTLPKLAPAQSTSSSSSSVNVRAPFLEESHEALKRKKVAKKYMVAE